jgi:hypothetical protein
VFGSYFVLQKEQNTVHNRKSYVKGHHQKQKMKKAIIPHVRRIEVENVRTPTRIVDPDTEEVSYGLAFLLLDGQSSKRYYRPCTREVFKICYGRHPGNDPNTLPVGGYSTLADYRYLLYLDNKDIRKATVTGITAIPTSFWGSTNAAPEQAKNIKSTVFEVNDDGSLRIHMREFPEGFSLPELAPTVVKSELLAVLSAIDKVDEITKDLPLPGGYEITEASNNRFGFTKF